MVIQKNLFFLYHFPHNVRYRVYFWLSSIKSLYKKWWWLPGLGRFCQNSNPLSKYSFSKIRRFGKFHTIILGLKPTIPLKKRVIYFSFVNGSSRVKVMWPQKLEVNKNSGEMLSEKIITLKKCKSQVLLPTNSIRRKRATKFSHWAERRF